MVIYQQWKHSCFLYLGSIIVDEFGLVASCQPGLVTMVHVSNLSIDCSIRYIINIVCVVCVRVCMLCACVCCVYVHTRTRACYASRCVCEQ